MATVDLLVRFAADVRAARAANPVIAGDGTALELLIAPHFQRLVEGILPGVTAAPLQVLPEYRMRGVGRPDLALTLDREVLGLPPRGQAIVAIEDEANEPA